MSSKPDIRMPWMNERVLREWMARHSENEMAEHFGNVFWDLMLVVDGLRGLLALCDQMKMVVEGSELERVGVFEKEVGLAFTALSKLPLSDVMTRLSKDVLPVDAWTFFLDKLKSYKFTHVRDALKRVIRQEPAITALYDAHIEQLSKNPLHASEQFFCPESALATYQESNRVGYILGFMKDVIKANEFLYPEVLPEKRLPSISEGPSVALSIESEFKSKETLVLTSNVYESMLDKPTGLDTDPMVVLASGGGPAVISESSGSLKEEDEEKLTSDDAIAADEAYLSDLVEAMLKPRPNYVDEVIESLQSIPGGPTLTEKLLAKREERVADAPPKERRRSSLASVVFETPVIAPPTQSIIRPEFSRERRKSSVSIASVVSKPETLPSFDRLEPKTPEQYDLQFYQLWGLFSEINTRTKTPFFDKLLHEMNELSKRTDPMVRFDHLGEVMKRLMIEEQGSWARFRSQFFGDSMKNPVVLALHSIIMRPEFSLNTSLYEIREVLQPVQRRADKGDGSELGTRNNL